MIVTVLTDFNNFYTALPDNKCETLDKHFTLYYFYFLMMS